ncbi:pantoate--beta-alanine ligase [Paenibacillus sp. GCM10027626]|uniref:pantoate--beta-alanine ligase n=1 Tax=Paenibacillus sp. GCM10027626 TaxID=3273411 RepID=UPI0036384345
MSVTICTTIEELRQRLRQRRKNNPDEIIGLIPTMGFLHEGHASLMQRARRECGFTVLSVFVNPLQFGPNEDFERYPRNIERDTAVAEANGIDLLFMPAVQEMYPSRPLTRVMIDEITARLCGTSRPGHFDGVGTVVSKLFHLVQPDRAYFGMKDAQQVAVIERMVFDLNIPVQIVRCETVREADGLAMSSRNVYLNEQERKQAVILNQTLSAAENWIKEKGITVQALEERIRQMIGTAAEANIDYVEIASYPDLSNLPRDTAVANISGLFIIALAVKFGSTRLIDNRLFQIGG